MVDGTGMCNAITCPLCRKTLPPLGVASTAATWRHNGHGVCTSHTPVAVYRAYDIFGSLLYVGISMNPDSRMAQHRNNASWGSRVAYVDVNWLPGRYGDPNGPLVDTARVIGKEQP